MTHLRKKMLSGGQGGWQGRAGQEGWSGAEVINHEDAMRGRRVPMSRHLRDEPGSQVWTPQRSANLDPTDLTGTGPAAARAQPC